MIIILSKVPSIEDILVAELSTYFDQLRFGELYRNFKTIRISLEHPFAIMWQQAKGNPGNAYDGSLFPSVTIMSGSDSKPGQLNGLNILEPCTLEESDLATLSASGWQVASGAVTWLNEWFVDHGALKGRMGTAHKSDQVSIDVWSESIQLKNEIYGLLMMYLSGPNRVRIENSHAITIFDGTVRGQRSGNYNMDFGQLLYGAHIDFQVDYMMQQSLFDSESSENLIPGGN